MEITNVRIDERLIHGQIITAWITYLKANRIVVIDDKAANDELQKNILRIACPSSIKLSVITQQKALDNFSINRYGDERIFVIFKNPNNLKSFIDLGFKFDEVNIGNISGKPGTTLIKRGVNVTHEEASILVDLADSGVKLTAKMVPNDESVDVVKLLRNVK